MISSSIFWVAIGSKELVGSSIKITSGCMAIVLAIQSLCCCPPDKLRADSLVRSLTSSHRAALIKESFTISSKAFLSFIPWHFGP